jgi:hypothetical protein
MGVYRLNIRSTPDSSGEGQEHPIRRTARPVAPWANVRGRRHFTKGERAVGGNGPPGERHRGGWESGAPLDFGTPFD